MLIAAEGIRRGLACNPQEITQTDVNHWWAQIFSRDNVLVRFVSMFEFFTFPALME